MTLLQILQTKGSSPRKSVCLSLQVVEALDEALGEVMLALVAFLEHSVRGFDFDFLPAGYHVLKNR
jgi:hypothetical protein